MFSVFLAILILPALLNASIPKHFILKSIWQARESHSTYSWIAWMSAVLINEVPYALLMSIIYWPLAYWPVGLPFGEPAGRHSSVYHHTDHNIETSFAFRLVLLQCRFTQFVHRHLCPLDVCALSWVKASQIDQVDGSDLSLTASPSLVANLLPFFLVSLNIYTGILVPWQLMTARECLPCTTSRPRH